MLTSILLVSLLSTAGDRFGPLPVFDDAAIESVATEKATQLIARRRTPKKPPPKGKEPPVTTAGEGAGAGTEAPVGGPLGRTSRIEFEGQLIKGQTTKAGEVQILERKDSEIKSMVKRRTGYREEIIRSVFPTVP